MTPIPIASLEAALRPSAEGPDLTRYLLVCGGLLALVAGLAWAVRRLLAGQMKARAARRSLQVLDLLPLGGKQRLAVVRCYDRTFLLGLGEKEVGLVSELDPVVTPAGGGGATSVEARSFADLLRRAGPREPRPRAVLDPEGVLG